MCIPMDDGDTYSTVFPSQGHEQTAILSQVEEYNIMFQNIFYINKCFMLSLHCNPLFLNELFCF